MEANPNETMHTRAMHNYKQGALYAAIVIGTVLSAITTGFRCYTRRKTAKRLRKDDWLMCIGLSWSFAVIAAIAHGLTVGLGDDVPNTDNDKKWLQRTSAAVMMMQNLCVFCIKASILCFNMSIFHGLTFKRVAWAVLIVTAVNSFTGFLIAFLQELAVCPRADKQCFGESKFVVPLTTAIIATACDVVIYIMPIPVLARLGVDRRTRIGLCVVFVLGLLCIGTSFARWAAMIQDHPNNGTSMPSDIRISLWTYVELSAGITCGNLPILAPIIGCVGPRRKPETGRSTPITDFNLGLRRSEQALRRPAEQEAGGNAGNKSNQTGSSMRRTPTPSPLRLSFTGSDIELNMVTDRPVNSSGAMPAEPLQSLTRSSSQRLSVLDRRRTRAGFESLG